LNLVGGLDRPDAGSLAFEGRPLNLDDSREMTQWRNRTVGFVFQFHFLLPDFTALENLLVPVHMDHVPGDADTARARGLLADLGLAEREDHLPGELSGGEQQRVAVARAFMNRPRIVLLDEPFGNLDREKGLQLGELLFDLRRREQTALVIVTHDLTLAERADRVLRLDGGRLVPLEEP
jgi:lipoprotein-releasing system ATP-binding protein